MFPVEVIYAPLDALGRDYAEDDGNAEAEDRASARAEAVHYLDGAVAAVERIIAGGAPGDVLVFLPSERDIREALDALEPRLRGEATLVPLFGRLTNAEQQRVFAPAPRRKVVVATNIAETSLTLPGIRFVVDAGLVRVSRYSPQARTRRLPIEPVSQSSAEQRKGRAGRVAPGTCIRLYSEADFLARPRFTQPEIQRANLADVILRLQAFGLGDIERFPFLNPPPAKAIRAGFGLLEELGALGPDPGGGAPRPLTPVGRELARLPVDPTVGRMILQARAEGALREVLVIAAGLSIQDPRERPLDRQAQADAAHRRFAHPDSDFLTLLAIWEAFHDDLERLSQARLRRYTSLLQPHDFHGRAQRGQPHHRHGLGRIDRFILLAGRRDPNDHIHDTACSVDLEDDRRCTVAHQGLCHAPAHIGKTLHGVWAHRQQPIARRQPRQCGGRLRDRLGHKGLGLFAIG